MADKICVFVTPEILQGGFVEAPQMPTLVEAHEALTITEIVGTPEGPRLRELTYERFISRWRERKASGE